MVTALEIHIQSGEYIGMKIPLTMSLQSKPIPIDGLQAEIILPSLNTHASYSFENEEVKNKILLSLRGRVTLDTKTLHAENGNACALIIIDTNGDPIGPDLDNLSNIIVCCVSKDYIDVLTRIGTNPIPSLGIIIPCDNLLGYCVSYDIGNINKYIINNRNHKIESSSLVDLSGHSYLHFCSSRDTIELLSILQLLLDHDNLMINDVDFIKGSTPLHIASNNGCSKVIKILCKYNSVMLPRTSDGKYPIHLAANNKHILCIIELKLVGTLCHQECHNGIIPLQLAAERGCFDCTRYLYRNSPNTIFNNNLNLSKFLLENSNGMANQYLNNVLIHELESFIKCEDHYKQEIINEAKERFINEVGDLVDHDSIEVILNKSCEISDLFISRFQQLCKSFSNSNNNSSYPPLRFLWHGCDPSIIDTILNSGFKVSYSNLSFNVYGAGIYFATDAKLSTYFITNNVREKVQNKPDSIDGKYSILFSAVSLGTTGVRNPLIGGNEMKKARMKSDLKHPANRNPPVGCNSATGIFLKELVVYEDLMAFPLAKIKFKLKSNVIVPDPYDLDYKLDRKYLKDLKDVSIGLGKFNIIPLNKNDTNIEKSFDDTELSIIKDAKLIMNWSPENRNGDATMEELIEKIYHLENKVFELEHENNMLKKQLL